MAIENAAPEPAAEIDLEYQPKSYWASVKLQHRKVEIASVNWNGNRTYRLMAHTHAPGLTYTWEVDGDFEEVPDDPESTEMPLSLDELLSVLEDNALAEPSLEESWGLAWTAAQENVDLNDSDAVEFALAEVAEAYSLSSDIYKQLSECYDQRFQSWRDQQVVESDEEESDKE